MNHQILSTALMAIALLLLPAGSLIAADSSQATAAETKSGNKAPAPEKRAAAKQPKAAPKLVDINGASKAELKTLPGITDERADKIIAGRPYRSKANLVTQNVLPQGAYEQIRTKIVALQKPDSKGKTDKKP